MIPQPIQQKKFRNDFKYQKKYGKGNFKNFANENRVSIPKEEEKNENSTLPKVKEEKVKSNFGSFEDFPELRVPTVNENVTIDERQNVNHFGKSWISVVSSVKQKSNFNESFPKLPNSKDFSKKKDNLSNPSSSEKKVENEIKELREAKSENYSQEESKSVKPKNKPVCSKKPTKQPQKNVNKKKRSDPIIFNFSDVIIGEVTKSKKKQPRFVANSMTRSKKKEIKFGNTLDSANPKLHRGKHREIKSKKFSRLKFAIIKERILKQKVREKAIADYFGKECSDLYTKINFEIEIKKYVEDLNKRKTISKQEDKIKNVSSCRKDENIELKDESLKSVERNNVKLEKTNDMPAKTNSTISKPGNNVFSSKLREYCDNIVTPSLNLAVGEFVRAVVNLQDKFFARDPIKAKVRRRHVSGLKEVKQHLILNKVKLIVIAPDLEKLQMEGSIFDLINELKSKAKEQNVPYVFALGRYKLGRCAKKNVPVSAFACLNYNGVEVLYDNVLKELNECKKKFNELTVSEKTLETKKESQADVTSEIISSFIKAFREGLHVEKKEKNDCD